VLSFFSRNGLSVLKVHKFKILSLWNWLAYAVAYMNKLRFFKFWTRCSTLFHWLILYTIQSLDFWNCFLTCHYFVLIAWWVLWARTKHVAIAHSLLLHVIISWTRPCLCIFVYIVLLVVKMVADVTETRYILPSLEFKTWTKCLK